MQSEPAKFTLSVQCSPSVRALLPESHSFTPALLQVISALLEQESAHLPSQTPVEVHFLLTDSETVQALNRTYRGRDQPTDVLSFCYLESPTPLPSGTPVCLGEVVISVPTALRQAAPNGHDPTTELLMLAVHGTLHLLGYTDETEQDQQVMNRRACSILQAFGYPAKEVWASRYDES